jgi:hypothetical protein
MDTKPRTKELQKVAYKAAAGGIWLGGCGMGSFISPFVSSSYLFALVCAFGIFAGVVIILSALREAKALAISGQ